MNRIKHDGIIHTIDEQGIHVRIVQMAACASCKVASQCQMSDKKEKMVDVDAAGHQGLKVGDRVVVYTEESMGFKAVFLAFLLPFLILVSVLVLVLALTRNEAWAVLFVTVLQKGCHQETIPVQTRNKSITNKPSL